MSKKIMGNEGPTLGISSSLEMFEKLKHESSLLVESWSPYDTFNFLVTGWHLFQDWPKSDLAGSLSRKKRNRRDLPKSMNLILDVVRDLVNGSKHFKLDRKSSEKRRVGEVHTGKEVGFYEYFFHEDIPAVTVEDHWYFSIRVLNNILLGYFEWVFNDDVPLDEFPDELEQGILFCNIAKRDVSKKPKLFYQGMEKTRHTHRK